MSRARTNDKEAHANGERAVEDGGKGGGHARDGNAQPGPHEAPNCRDRRRQRGDSRRHGEIDVAAGEVAVDERHRRAGVDAVVVLGDAVEGARFRQLVEGERQTKQPDRDDRQTRCGRLLEEVRESQDSSAPALWRGRTHAAIVPQPATTGPTIDGDRVAGPLRRPGRAEFGRSDLAKGGRQCPFMGQAPSPEEGCRT